MKELQQDKNYEIVVVPFNSQGEGPASPPTTVYVGEAVPTGEPRGLEGEAVSSTEVRLRWKPPQQHMQNGELLGYKVSKQKCFFSFEIYLKFFKMSCFKSNYVYAMHVLLLTMFVL